MKNASGDSECLLVITSYDIARRDHQDLGRLAWLYVVVDEGHHIKNPNAARTKTIKTLNGRYKLALTGTPIQNNLEELWSLFDFAMPGYLGTRAQFRKSFGRNERINWDAVRSGTASLKNRINPFILRRLKGEVATDLPPKIVVDLKVELTPRQVALYKQVLASAECEKLIEEIKQNGARRSKVLALAAYTKLRAICNHPVLADHGETSRTVVFSESGKMDRLGELVEEIVEGEHRALLFSQSTRVLDMIENYLGGVFKNRNNIFIRLDGSTPGTTRSELVERYNSDSSIVFFLISTRAGGTGLNLTGADTVIFYDHDWNPANDNQAQDRAHRIGQTKPVTVYRLITKGTIEEKIIERQATKQTLADEIIGTDEQGFKELTSEELVSLFTLD
jgi:SNF2 family DNA or RNA helicase